MDIFNRTNKRREQEAGLADAVSASAPAKLPPYGSMTLGGKAKPADPAAEAAKKEALLRLLRARGTP